MSAICIDFGLARGIRRLGLLMGLMVAIGTAAAEGVVPAGFEVPEESLSPDGRLGVTVPMLPENGEQGDQKNSLIEMKTGRVVAVVDGYTGWDRVNHETVLPARWSKDGSLLIWSVDGKWAPRAIVVLQLKDGAVAWQLDVVKAAQQAVLERTRKAAPDKYAQAKKDNAGSGSAYPEGFTIDVAVTDPVKLPLKVTVALTSDPKGIHEDTALTSHLEGLVTKEGKFVVTGFGLGLGVSEHF